MLEYCVRYLGNIQKNDGENNMNSLYKKTFANNQGFS